MAVLKTCIVFLLLSFGVARADEPKPDDKGWEPVSSDMMQRGESIPASSLVAGAYGFIFAAVALWVASVVARTRRLEEEMTALERRLKEQAK
jgi:hypothetical protein